MDAGDEDEKGDEDEAEKDDETVANEAAEKERF